MKRNEEEKRQARRKRRIRNQIISYILLIIIVAVVAFLGYKGIKFIVSRIKSNATAPVVEAVSENEAVSEEVVQVISTPDYDIPEVSENEVAISENNVENAAARTFIDGLSTEQKVASLFIVSPESITGVQTATQAGEGTRTALSNYMVGGIIYASKNATGEDAFKTMIQTTKDMYSELYGCDLWVAVREEGASNTIAGGATGVSAEPSASELGESGDNNNAYVSYVNIATYLNDYGVDINVAPVCDVNTNGDGFVGNRAFSSDADIAASMVKSAVSGETDNGIVSCIGSFPGQGELATDPANGVASTEKTLDEMKEWDMKPFEAGIEAGANMVMMSNIIAANATGEAVPCSMSEDMIRVLREDLGFEGIIVSGYMDDKAVTGQFSQGEAAVNAINAGCDMILRPADFEAAYNGVLDAVNDGTISAERLDEALMNIYSNKF